jgi:putative nucleotidyltransferase with HDIG domain
MALATQNLTKHAHNGNPPVERSPQVAPLVASLQRTFGVEFSIYDGQDGQLLHRSEEQPVGDAAFRGELAKAVAHRAEPAFLGEEEPLLILALPALVDDQQLVVAVATFATRHVDEREPIDDAAQLLGLSAAHARRWINAQEPWSGRQLNAVGQTVLEQLKAQRHSLRLTAEIEKVSDNLASTYEEISVLYGVTQNLQLSSTDEELGRLALQWLTDVIPAAGLAIQYLPAGEGEGLASRRRQPQLLTAGECPLDDAGFAELTKYLQLDAQHGPVVLNRGVTGKAGWKFPSVTQLIVVPLAQADHLCGWMAAFNHVDNAEFGTVEASLMGSVGAILGIHSGNIELYRRQSDFLAQMVRALTSAIDAKDPYTCGHSDRVARVSVRLAQEIGCDVKTLNRLYLGGLLHDIGKIGIDDQVLRKPGRLTPAEFEHIKLHPELGYNILRDVKQLEDVLPIVLHHHESWDGTGYPHGLAGEEIPQLARICAVADAFDAMSSDRPYREGMPDEKVDSIFRDGAGKQWDAEVVAAFFSAREDIRDIAREERANLSLDVQQWM